jgi:hypothetical protein
MTINDRLDLRGEGRFFMSRFYRVALLSLLSIFAAGVGSSTSASADSCAGGTQSVVCFSDTPIHSEKILGEGGLVLLSIIAGFSETRIHCTRDLFKATLKLLGLATGEFNYLGCTVEKLVGCKVGEGANKLFLASIHLQLSSGLVPATGLATGAGPGEEFINLIIEGAGCSIAGTYKITGLQTLEFPSGETSLVEHEVVAKKALSKLHIGSLSVALSNKTKVHLTSGLSWLIMLGI